MRNILVTGGAGYIGSVTTLELLDAGYNVMVVDNLSRGHRDAVDPARLQILDLLDTDGLVRVMRERPFDAVVHFAAFIAVGESMKAPELYFHNNTAGSLSLLSAMRKTGLDKIVFGCDFLGGILRSFKLNGDGSLTLVDAQGWPAESMDSTPTRFWP